MKIIKIILFITVTSLLSLNALAQETLKNCSEIKNLYKKIVCKANIATSQLDSKKTLADYLPNNPIKKKK